MDDPALAVLGPDSIFSLPYIKLEIAKCVYADCGTYSMTEVTRCFGRCQTAKEVRDKVRCCCKNPRGGQEIMRKDGTMYKVPTINERAACSLLDALINRGAWEGELLENVKKMRAKMRG